MKKENRPRIRMKSAREPAYLTPRVQCTRSAEKGCNTPLISPHCGKRFVRHFFCSLSTINAFPLSPKRLPKAIFPIMAAALSFGDRPYKVYHKRRLLTKCLNILFQKIFRRRAAYKTPDRCVGRLPHIFLTFPARPVSFPLRPPSARAAGRVFPPKRPQR